MTSSLLATFKFITFMVSWMLLSQHSFSQSTIQHSDCEQPATIILFRTFNFYSFKFSYNIFEGDSLIGRIKTHDVLILETYDRGVSFHASTKAPSLNADKQAHYQKTKKIVYPFSLQPGQAYFVKCDFLNQNLFDFPRQPTIKLLKKEDEIKKYLNKKFLKKKIQAYLYNEWLTHKNLNKYVKK